MIAAGFGLGGLAFLEEKYGLPYLVFDIYLYAWVASFIGLFLFIPPWLPPRCTKCGKRMMKTLVGEEAGQQRIYFICRDCGLKADTGISTGD